MLQLRGLASARSSRIQIGLALPFRRRPWLWRSCGCGGEGAGAGAVYGDVVKLLRESRDVHRSLGVGHGRAGRRRRVAGLRWRVDSLCAMIKVRCICRAVPAWCWRWGPEMRTAREGRARRRQAGRAGRSWNVGSRNALVRRRDGSLTARGAHRPRSQYSDFQQNVCRPHITGRTLAGTLPACNRQCPRPWKSTRPHPRLLLQRHPQAKTSPASRSKRCAPSPARNLGSAH